MEGVIPTVAGSASFRDNTIFVTLTNSHASEAAEVGLDLLGGVEIGAEGVAKQHSPFYGTQHAGRCVVLPHVSRGGVCSTR